MTKDGINAQSSAAFFKSIKEESSVTIEEVVGTLGKTYKWELPVKARPSDEVVRLNENSVQNGLK
jgi:translocation protein SEC63